MTLQEFISKYQGKTIGYPGDSYKGECLSLVKQYIKEVFNFDPPASGCNGARCYWSIFPDPLGKYFTKVPNTLEAIPSPGDIVVWNEQAGGGYGHIAIVTEANQNSFKSFDQNWGGRHAHIVTHNYTNVYGWLTPLKPENKPIGGQMQIDKKVFEELVGKATKYDEFVAAGYASAKAVTDKVKELQKDKDSKSKEIKELKGELANQALYVSDLIEERTNHLEQIRNLEKELAATKSSVDPTHFSLTLAVMSGKIDTISDQLGALATKSNQEQTIKKVKDIEKAVKKLSPSDVSTPDSKVPAWLQKLIERFL